MKNGEKDIRRLFPELDSMENQALAGLVCSIWLDVLERSSWEGAGEALFGYGMPEITLASHTQAVLKHALSIADALAAVHSLNVTINKDILIAGCILHDVDKMLMFAPDGKDGCIPTDIGFDYQHGFFSAYYAEQAGLPSEIVTMIIAHTAYSRVMPSSLEGVILYFADMADAEVVKYTYGHIPSVLTAIGKLPNKRPKAN